MTQYALCVYTYISHTYMHIHTHICVHTYVNIYVCYSYVHMCVHCNSRNRGFWLESDDVREAGGRGEGQYYNSISNIKDFLKVDLIAESRIIVIKLWKWEGDGEVRDTCSFALLKMHENMISQVKYFQWDNCDYLHRTRVTI